MITIAVTGADGQLGSEIRQMSGFYPGYRFSYTDRNDLDITDRSAVKRYIDSVKPNWVINCAAYTAVDDAEKNRDLAMNINAKGVGNIVSAISGRDTGLIQISTDYVFDGKSDRPYREDDLPAPVSVYGESKLEGENEALESDRAIVIRTSWLYSQFGKNFPLTMIRLAKEKPELRVVCDQTGSPTYSEDLVKALLTMVKIRSEEEKPENPEIYHLSGGGYCSWYQFAAEIISPTKTGTRVTPVTTEEFPLPAKRPMYSVLDNSKILNDLGLQLPEWRTSLKRFLSLVEANK